jgi:hypothetical protein
MTGIPGFIVHEELKICAKRASRILQMVAKESQHREEDKGNFRENYVSALRKINSDLAQVEMSCFEHLTYGNIDVK